MEGEIVKKTGVQVSFNLLTSYVCSVAVTQTTCHPGMSLKAWMNLPGSYLLRLRGHCQIPLRRKTLHLLLHRHRISVYSRSHLHHGV